MLHSLLAILITLAAVGAKAPENRTTTIVKFSDGTTAAVFWDDRQEQVGKDWVRVQFDEPWLSQPRYWKGRESTLTVERTERQSDREKRIRAGWEQVGFVEVNGQRVPIAEAQLADRAKEMAGLNQKQPAAAPSPLAETSVQGATTQPPPPPSFITLWGAHIVVLVCAAILLVVIIKVFFLAPSE